MTLPSHLLCTHPYICLYFIVCLSLCSLCFVNVSFSVSIHSPSYYILFMHCVVSLRFLCMIAESIKLICFILLLILCFVLFLFLFHRHCVRLICQRYAPANHIWITLECFLYLFPNGSRHQFYDDANQDWNQDPANVMEKTFFHHHRICIVILDFAATSLSFGLEMIVPSIDSLKYLPSHSRSKSRKASISSLSFSSRQRTL